MSSTSNSSPTSVDRKVSHCAAVMRGVLDLTPDVSRRWRGFWVVLVAVAPVAMEVLVLAETTAGSDPPARMRVAAAVVSIITNSYSKGLGSVVFSSSGA